ncbi:MAG: DUF4860 domain-containing protein [Ruminococcaceae bacterium]|nr:DUF4860 domain-containing protein [Oscillospiraceae bacterium]
MTNHSSKRNLIGLVPILLFVILAASVLSILLSSADTYASITERGNSTYTTRTAAQYISTKLHQSDGVVGVEIFGQDTAVTITETINNQEYITRIYCYEGYLYELFSNALADMSPEDGEKLLPMDSMTATVDNGLLTIDIAGQRIVFAIRANKEG